MDLGPAAVRSTLPEQQCFLQAIMPLPCRCISSKPSELDAAVQRLLSKDPKNSREPAKLVKDELARENPIKQKLIKQKLIKQKLIKQNDAVLKELKLKFSWRAISHGWQ